MKIYNINLQIADETLEWFTAYDIDITKKYPLILDNKNKLYNNRECYSYALKNMNLCDIEQGYFELLRLYNNIALENIKEKDIIVYARTKILNANTIEHFAIVTNIENNNIKIKSKWGLNGIFEGSYDLLPEFYGSYFSIWRKNKNSPTEKYKSVKNETVRF